MKTVTKKEQASIVGAAPFWAPKAAPGGLTYLHGADSFDEIRNESAVDSPLNLSVRPHGLAVSIMHKFKTHYVAIPFSILKHVCLETPADIVCRKEKSIVGQALVRGGILGPVGAIIGALSGAADRAVVTKQDSLLTITAEENSSLVYLVASIEPGILVTGLRHWLQKNLASYYQE